MDISYFKNIYRLVDTEIVMNNNKYFETVKCQMIVCFDLFNVQNPTNH